MKIFIISLLFFCTIIGCSNTDEKTNSSTIEPGGTDMSKKAGVIALNYCFAVRDDDFDFIINHNEQMREELHEKEITYPTSEFKRFKKQFHDRMKNQPKTEAYSFMQDFVSKAHLSVTEVRLLDQESKSVFGIPLEKTAYLVFIRAHFKRVEDAIMDSDNKHLIKQVIFRVIMIEHSGDLFVNGPGSFRWENDFEEQWPNKEEMQQEILRRKTIEN